MLLVAGQVFSAAKDIKGHVRCGSEGIGGVIVSDGTVTTATDSKGRFRLKADDDSRFVFISTPAGYESPVTDGVITFFKTLSEESVYDFELTKKETDDRNHEIIAIADPQVYDRSEFGQLEAAVSDIKEYVSSSGEGTIGICCGDITSHDHGMYGEINSILAGSGISFRYALGNHDMKIWGRSNESSTMAFEPIFGPSYYSFNVGDVHYVVLNDNFFIGRDYFYIGYLEEKQLRWLENDLSHIKEGSTVIVSMHIPSTLSEKDRERFRYDDISTTLCNKKALYEILKPYRAYILSGHMHTLTNQEVSDSLYEHNLAALSGAWWCGDICLDGTPAGYKIFRVKGNDISWQYKAIGKSLDEMMSVHTGDNGDLIVNIWDWDEKWTAEYSGSDGERIPLVKVSGMDPAAAALYSNPSGLKHKWISPDNCNHLFKIPASKRKPGEKEEIIVTTRFGECFRKAVR